jgi:hypothetical protein
MIPDLLKCNKNTKKAGIIMGYGGEEINLSLTAGWLFRCHISILALR